MRMLILSKSPSSLRISVCWSEGAPRSGDAGGTTGEVVLSGCTSSVDSSLLNYPSFSFAVRCSDDAVLPFLRLMFPHIPLIDPEQRVREPLETYVLLRG